MRRFHSAPWTAGVLLLAACSAPAPDSTPIPEPTSALRPAPDRGVIDPAARIADYEIDARLESEARAVTGSAKVTWRNTTGLTVDTVPFHLYMNGFRSEDTAWMRSSRGSHRGNEQTEEGAWGYIDVESVRLVAESTDGPPALSEDEQSPPAPAELDWSEDEDPSTMTVRLPRPVGPGESITLALDFMTVLPKVIARTGYGDDDFYAVGQWYPKIAVLDEDGWNAHTFTYHDEFFADFGNYRVQLDVPENLVVGATGIRTADSAADGRRQLTYEAEMVHDFAWMADPDFVETWGEWNGVRIRQLIQPEFIDDADDHMQAQIAAFDSYDKRFGPYPWSTLTIVHVPEGAEGAGGMEYPTLYTTSDIAPLPSWIRRHVLDERVSGINTTVHEFGHQYFQGLFASREHAEPWLDEGVNTFSNELAYNDRYGTGADGWALKFLGHTLHRDDASRLGLAFRGDLVPVDRPASAFQGALGAYGMTVYQKTGAVFQTLRNLAGHERFDRAFRAYADEARFGHPTGDDLERTLVDRLGPSLSLAGDDGEAQIDVASFFEQALQTTKVLDFSLVRVRNRRLMQEAGWQRDAAGELVGGELADNFDTELEDLDDSEVEGIVAVQRKGDFELPVQVRVEFADDSQTTLAWQADERSKVYRFPGQRVRRVLLDPDRLLTLEVMRANNTAWADDLRSEGEVDDGLSRPVGLMVEATALAALAGVGP